jgi:hypothetical protein
VWKPLFAPITVISRHPLVAKRSEVQRRRPHHTLIDWFAAFGVLVA